MRLVDSVGNALEVSAPPQSGTAMRLFVSPVLRRSSRSREVVNCCTLPSASATFAPPGHGLPKPSGVVSRQQRLVGRSDADSATKRVRGELENTVASLGSMLGSEVSAGGGKKPIPAAAA